MPTEKKPARPVAEPDQPGSVERTNESRFVPVTLEELREMQSRGETFTLTEVRCGDVTWKRGAGLIEPAGRENPPDAAQGAATDVKAGALDSVLDDRVPEFQPKK